MKSLIEVIQQISLVNDVNTVQSITAMAARVLTEADCAAFIVRDQDGFHIHEQAISPRFQQQSLPIDEHAADWCLNQGQISVSENIVADEPDSHEAYSDTAVRCVVLIPIGTRKREPSSRILALYWLTPHTPTDDELEPLRILIDYVALALTNIQLASELNTLLQERAASLQVKTREAEEANRSKIQLLSVASHNLRQPLQNLATQCAVLLRKHTDPELQLNLYKMQNIIGDMRQLINSILNLHQLENGRLTPNIRTFNLQDLLPTLKEQFRGMAEAKGLALEIYLAPLHVQSDPDFLEQILSNLLENALKYTQKGQVTLDCLPRDDSIQIRVCDTGPGIPASEQPDVFEPFFRLDRHKKNASGYGLGLAIVKSLSDLLKFPLVLESGENGSVFSIQVPYSPTDYTKTDIPLEKEKATILYLEDDIEVSDAVGTLLQMEGYKVIQAHAGEEAIHLLRKSSSQPDLIITDNRLSTDESGVEFIKRVRSFLQKEIPAIMLTGYTEKSLQEKAFPTVQKVLYKPVDADVLLSACLSLI